MKMLVLGATGATGALLVDQALAAGHRVRVLVRSPEKLSLTHPDLEVVTGQATDPHDVGNAMAGMDVVISTLGAAKGSVMTDATRAIIAGADQSGVRRVVVLSSFAVLRARLSGVAKLVSALSMGEMLRDKATAEELLRASELDWTVVHAVRLTNGRAAGRTSVVPASATLRLRTSVTRSDVAERLLSSVSDAGWFRHALVVAG
ncbi:NAD(P)-binding oxidoreductase [Amycolatopsis sp. NPDC048633]|uniref:NAD(P)-dependent oxidoreductase n=1 Tax=Amycolatopsis sp. NPDC048633 TaxID=3157095 RepID=UPI0033C47654